MTVLLVPWEGGEVPIFDVPGELIVRLAPVRYGLRLVGRITHIWIAESRLAPHFAVIKVTAYH